MDIAVLLVGVGLILITIVPLRLAYRAGEYSGARKAAEALARGMGSRCDGIDGETPATLASAIDASKVAANLNHYLEHLGYIGYEMGLACWQNGIDFQEQLTARKDNGVQTGLLPPVLSELRWAAQMGFHALIEPSHNVGFQTEEEAERSHRAIEAIERSMPRDSNDNNQHIDGFIRQSLILNRWPAHGRQIRNA